MLTVILDTEVFMMLRYSFIEKEELKINEKLKEKVAETTEGETKILKQEKHYCAFFYI